jgi:hypothetical protein
VAAPRQLPDPTEIQYDISVYLQPAPGAASSKRSVESGKSWLTAAYVLWRLLCNPEERVLVVSASKDRADAFTTFVRRLIEEVPMLTHLKPRKRSARLEPGLRRWPIERAPSAERSQRRHHRPAHRRPRDDHRGGRH